MINKPPGLFLDHIHGNVLAGVYHIHFIVTTAIERKNILIQTIYVYMMNNPNLM